jgi:hypothetical protein
VQFEELNLIVFQMNVERDNIKFMREKERSAASSLFAPSTSATANRWPKKKDGDEDDEDDGGPGRSCGGNDFNAPGRFVC